MQHYLENSATTKVCEEAARAALFAMTEVYGNPSSTHTKGREAKKLLDKARAQTAGAKNERNGTHTDPEVLPMAFAAWETMTFEMPDPAKMNPMAPARGPMAAAITHRRREGRSMGETSVQ